MSPNVFVHKFAVLIGAVMILAGAGLGILAIQQLPSLPGVEKSALAAGVDLQQLTQAEPTSPAAKDLHSVGISSGDTIAMALAAGLPTEFVSATTGLVLNRQDMLITTVEDEHATVIFDWDASSGEAIYNQFFAAATRFDTINLNLRSLHIERAWNGDKRTFQSIAVLKSTLPALNKLLGKPGASVVAYDEMNEVVAASWADRETLALVPFDRLVPSLAVYSVDGQTPVENAVKFNPSAYPLVATVYAHLQPSAPSDTLSRLSATLPATNRDGDLLTVVAMTGVTAMVRLTAEQMDQRGAAWPAEVVGPELATADITVVSNEVPFVPDCETNTDEDNLVFCSKPEYMEALTASGVDIVGLTGNHQNDFGLEDALTSLTIYEDAGLPVYGGGADKAHAEAPFFIEHNGNRLAFLGANSYGPPSAWATEFSPGSAPFDLSAMSAIIRSIKEKSEADVVLSELQYQESYDVIPLYDQRLDFSALARAGADIVTGVQSHVPQAVEFVDGRLVLYGLGNLYFDQMWTEDTREGLIVKHTIYAGRHISTQLLPTLLFDYGQPRWPDPQRRAAILAKVFGASVWP